MSSGLVVEFLTWANCNSKKYNPNKCKELVIKKKGTLELLGLTFQNDCKFSAHVKAKLCRKANKCLHVLRVCRKGRYSQIEIDCLFYSIVLFNLAYGLSFHGASNTDLSVFQQFLDRSHKLPFISVLLSIKCLLHKQEKAILGKVKHCDNHPLQSCFPEEKIDLKFKFMVI